MKFEILIVKYRKDKSLYIDVLNSFVKISHSLYLNLMIKNRFKLKKQWLSKEWVCYSVEPKDAT
jgi:hypothetical protein